MKKSKFTVEGLILIAILFGGLVFTGWRFIESDPDTQLPARAMKEAKALILKQVVGARKVSELEVVKVAYHTYTVQATVDGLNQYGGPARNVVLVQMENDSAGWTGKIVEDKPWTASMK
jgi:hypothetical protein